MSRKVPLIKAMASLFQTKFTTGTPYLHWSFDRLDDGHFQAVGTISNASEYPAELQSSNQKSAPVSGAVNAADCQAPGPFGNAFSMQGNGLFAQTTFPSIGGQAPRTVAAWVRRRAGRNYSDSASYCSWGNPAPGQMWGGACAGRMP